jgi:TolB protein
MNYRIALLWVAAVSLSLVASQPLSAASDEKLVIIKQRDSLGFLKPVPVYVSGFTGEADSVLKNDLLFMGVQHVPVEQAQYLISGSNASRVEGRLTDKSTKYQLLAKAYTGGNQRAQIHAFADDIAKALTQLPGIAQTKIAFKVEPGARRSEVYLADFDGHNPVAVTTDQSLVSAPCWAGRGSLVYASYKLGNPNIFSHGLATGARKAVARYPGDNYSPAVSPDGQQVAMILNKGGSPDLYVCNLDGSGLKQLTKTREAESSPCWSPDNQTICFVSREGGAAALFAISASGGGKRRPLAISGAPNPSEPDWSPDGKWLAFTTLTRAGFTICIGSPQGGSAIPVVAGEDPSWAPNSRALMYCSGPDHAKKLSLLDVPTKQVKTLARILESNSSPSWAK